MEFRPGLVGGHCIDPYYLTHKAQQVGYNPEIILAGRRLNDNMGIYVIKNSTFKEFGSMGRNDEFKPSSDFFTII